MPQNDTRQLAIALERTRAAQQLASDPTTSAWVSANAGTGKTYVLTARILRLLLAGTKPERILALTYTKAAAAEMSKRVFDRLGMWVTASPAMLEKFLTEVLGRAPNEHERLRARQLFATAIETPGGLKVQTIHSFCERLLKRFPLEAGIPPQFSILDEPTAATLLREAIDGMLSTAVDQKTGPLGRALDAAVAFASDDTFDDVLSDALHHRSWLDGLSKLDGQKAIERVYRRALGMLDAIDRAGAEQAMADVLDAKTIMRASDVLGAGKVSDQKLAEHFRKARDASSTPARAAALQRALLTGDDEPRSDKAFITKDIRAAEPTLTNALMAARDKMPALLQQRQTLMAMDATVALAVLASDVLNRYRLAKDRRAALDFDDLIAKAASLLSQISAEGETSATQWVLFKLDGGLDHILVDEAQDTSPEQWSVIRALAAEFFSDSAGHGVERTLFTVGDEKQSIYGFQGAAPAMFKATGDRFQADAAAVGKPFARVPLNVSFRTTAPVLSSVDQVFGDPVRIPGVALSGEPIVHIAHRAGHAGTVEVWPTEKPIEPTPSELWQPNDEQQTPSTVARLADRIAATIEGWLKRGEILASEDRPVRPSDILILVRRRKPFAPTMVAALKKRGIAVAGADRLTLVDQIAVQDLMALGDFLTLPEDDLALACVLKSPLFGLSDDDLMPLAYKRPGQLWTHLLKCAPEMPRLAEAANLLKQWRSEADFMPPYEFFASLLDRDNGRMRKRLLARLGQEAADPIDEFLNQALKFDDGAPASLTGFLAAVRESETEIKRDMEQGRDEVRIMTVHGAKGLEAPIVILPDTCSARSGSMPGALLKLVDVPMPQGIGHLMLWPVKSTKSVDAVADARAAQKMSDQEERNRLLYVALTRPRDRLYVTGYEGNVAPPAESWYSQIVDALKPTASSALGADGSAQALHFSCPQDAAPKLSEQPLDAGTSAQPPPDWALQRARSEPRLVMPLAPSRLAPLETDETGEPVHVPDASPREPRMFAVSRTEDQVRFLRGTLTHALLEHLPDLPRADWEAAAAHFLLVRGAALTDAGRASILREVMAILQHKIFGDLFGAKSQAEVPIVAEIPRPGGKGPPLIVNGQIDRLAHTEHGLLVIDYKTNRPPPEAVTGVAEAYLLQLSAYRLALARVFPGVPVKPAILWTYGARLMEIPSPLLDAAEQRLWTLDVTKAA